MVRAQFAAVCTPDSSGAGKPRLTKFYEQLVRLARASQRLVLTSSRQLINNRSCYELFSQW